MKKWNIQKRLLALVLMAGILSFLTLSSFSFYGMNTMHREMEEVGGEVGKAGASFTRNLIMYQMKKTLGEVSRSRADFIEQEVELIRQDVKMLANTMTQIASHPENYRPVKLLNPQFEPVHNTETYLTYGPDVKRDGLTPEMEYEIGIAGNISTVMTPMAKTFSEYKSAFYVGSKHGWFICSSVFPDNKGALPFEESEFFDYDPRERPWYKAAIAANAPVFSDIYHHFNIGEYQLVSCSAPYYDKNGVAGVVGLDISTRELDKIISDMTAGESGFSFVLDEEGEIIFCTTRNAKLLELLSEKDLRQSSGQSLAYAAGKMVKKQSGILAVTIDNEEYYLAYAPVKNIGWSFA